MYPQRSTKQYEFGPIITFAILCSIQIKAYLEKKKQKKGEDKSEILLVLYLDGNTTLVTKDDVVSNATTVEYFLQEGWNTTFP